MTGKHNRKSKGGGGNTNANANTSQSSQKQSNPATDQKEFREKQKKNASSKQGGGQEGLPAQQPPKLSLNTNNNNHESLNKNQAAKYQPKSTASSKAKQQLQQAGEKRAQNDDNQNSIPSAAVTPQTKENKSSPQQHQLDQSAVELARTFALWKNPQTLTVGSYVDAKDSLNFWCVAQVTEEDGDAVKLHYEGWGPKYDAIVRKNSNKMAPFRSQTKGYTGQPKNAFRDFKIDPDYQQKITERVQEVIQTNFGCFSSAHEVTQFIRGELYFYVDSLLTLQMHQNSSDLPWILGFVSLCIDLILSWLENFSPYIEIFYKSKQIPQLFLTDKNAAISDCCFELVEIFGKFWGLCPRSQKYFEHWKNEYIFDGEFCNRDQIASNGFGMSLTNLFGSKQGFDRILRALSNPVGFELPLQLTSIVLRQFKFLGVSVSKSFMCDFSHKVIDLIQNRLDYINETELKEINSRVAKSILQILEKFIQISDPKRDASKISETYELRIALKLLKCPFFERKLRGMTEFKEMFRRIELSQKQQYDANMQMPVQATKYLTFQTYAQWVAQENILEYIFIEKPHSELIKRSLELVYLRTLNKQFPLSNELINQIWVCANEKHDDIMRATLTVIENLSPFMSPEILEAFWNHIKLMPNSMYDEKRIHFLKKFTQGAFQALLKFKQNQKNQKSSSKEISANKQKQDKFAAIFKKEKGSKAQQQDKDQQVTQIDASKYFDLKKFWDIGTEPSYQISQKTKDLAIQCLIKILETYCTVRNFQNQNSKIDFMNLALQNLVKQNQMFVSINFIKNLILTYPKDSQSSQQQTSNRQRGGGGAGGSQSASQLETREGIISQLIKQDIFTKLIKNALNYQLVTKESKSPVKRDSFDETPKSLLNQNRQLAPHERLLHGDNFTHKQYVDCFLDFIEFIIVNSKTGNLSFTNIKDLYNCFVTNAFTEYESQQFFLLITKENENANSRERRYLLDERRRSEVFEKIMCNREVIDVKNLGMEFFSCFQLLFLNVNAESGSLHYNAKNGKFSIADIKQFQRLQGFNSLFQIGIESRVGEVSSNARDFFVQIYLKTNVESKHKKGFVENFVQRIESTSLSLQKALQQGQISKEEHTQMRLNQIRLIQTFISKFDYEHVELEDIKKYDPKENLDIKVQLKDENTRHVVQVNGHQQIWQLIIRIARLYKIRIPEFRIYTKKGNLNERIYSDVINLYTIKDLTLVKLDQKVLNQENPRCIMGQDETFFKNVVQLLHDQNEEEESVTSQIISLLESLPVNQALKKEFKEEIVSMEADKDELAWQKLFSVEKERGVTASSYTKIVKLKEIILEESLLMDKGKSNSQNFKQTEFMKTFIDKGGFKFLASLFQQIKIENLEKSLLRIKLLTQLISVFVNFFSKNLYVSIGEQLDEQMIYDLFCKNVEVFILFVNRINEEQNKNQQVRENFSWLLVHQTDLVFEVLHLMQQMIFLQPMLIQVLYECKAIEQALKVVYVDLKSQLIQAKVSSCLLNICKRLNKDLVLDQNVQQEELDEEVKDSQDKKASQGVEQLSPCNFFMQLILKRYLPEVANVTTRTEGVKELFNLANSLILEKVSSKLLDNDLVSSMPQLIQQLSQMIRDRPILESFSAPDTEDHVLAGTFTLLRNFFKTFPKFRQNLADKNSLMGYLLHECLFKNEISKQLMIAKNKTQPPKCKKRNTRIACLQLLKELAIENQSGVRLLVDYMRSTLYQSNVSMSWRTPRFLDWQISASDKQEKNSCGFVGLKNTGCICYLNSIMQQLYMIPSFRKLILEVEDRQYGQIPDSENVLYQMKRIFGGLMQLEKQYYNPKKFCLAFKDSDGLPIDPKVQKDVDEFSHMLIDKIETLIKGTPEENALKNLFYGVFANEIICKGCPHRSEREEPFMAIPLTIRNKQSILESLETFVKAEMLEGDNAYHCNDCNLKRDSLKRCTIKRLPNVLFLELKRFEFNYDTFSKHKINDYCSFPEELDMSAYSQEHVGKQDILKEMEERNLTEEDLDQNKRAVLRKTMADEYFTYRLKGVVVHNGTSESGHYYSFIQDRESEADLQEDFSAEVSFSQMNQKAQKLDQEGNTNAGKNEALWYEFNDKLVNHFDKSEIASECFGGENKDWQETFNAHEGDSAMQQVMNQQNVRMKTRSAYILIYERAAFIDQKRLSGLLESLNNTSGNETEQSISEEESLVGSNPQQHQLMMSSEQYKEETVKIFNMSRSQRIFNQKIQIPEPIQEAIFEKNRRFWLTRFIFSRNFLENSLEIFKSIAFKTNNSTSKTQENSADQTNQDNGGSQSDLISAAASNSFSEEEDQLEILKYIITFTQTVAFRASVRAQIPHLVRLIRQALKNKVRLARWYCQVFCDQRIIKEFFEDCTVGDMARFTAGLLKTAMQTLYKFEEKSLESYVRQMENDKLKEYIKENLGDKLERYRHKSVINGYIYVENQNVETTQQMTPQTPKTPGELPSYQTQQPTGEKVYTGAEKVSIYDLKRGFSSQIPTLVILINNILHYQTCSSLLASFQNSIFLHSVVSHFAQLGSTARQYLLKSKTLGRLLTLVLEQKVDPSSENIAQMHRLVPLFNLVYMKTDAYLTPNQTDNIDAKVSKKERTTKGVQVVQPPLMFVIKTISQLVCSLNFPRQTDSTDQQAKLSPFYCGNASSISSSNLFDVTADIDEVNLILANFAHRVWWRIQAQEFPMVRNCVATMFTHVAFQNIEFSNAYITQIFKVLQQANFMTIKKYERSLLQLVKLRDEFQQDRVTLVLNKLYETIKKSTKIWKTCDQLIELLCKLAHRSKKFAYELSRNNNLFKMVEEVTRENPCFTLDQQRLQLFREGTIYWKHHNDKQALVSQEQINKISAYSLSRLQKLKQRIDSCRGLTSQQLSRQIEKESSDLATNPSFSSSAQQQKSTNGKNNEERKVKENQPSPTNKEAAADSDDDCYAQEIEEGSSVDAFFDRTSSSGWYSAKVVFSLDEMVRVQMTYQSGTTKDWWIELESNKIAPLHTKSNSVKWQNFQYFTKLHQLVEPAGGLNNQVSAGVQK